MNQDLFCLAELSNTKIRFRILERPAPGLLLVMTWGPVQLSYRQKGSALRLYVGWTLNSLFDQSPVKRSRNTKSEAIFHIHPYAMFSHNERTSGTGPFILPHVFVISFLCVFCHSFGLICILAAQSLCPAQRWNSQFYSRHSFQENPEFISRRKAKPKRSQKRSLISKKCPFTRPGPRHACFEQRKK